MLSQEAVFFAAFFITLLPKKVDAVHVKDYRPISLIHSFAKLVAKLLANGLTPHLPNLASINQSAFVKGRSIQDTHTNSLQLTPNSTKLFDP